MKSLPFMYVISESIFIHFTKFYYRNHERYVCKNIEWTSLYGNLKVSKKFQGYLYFTDLILLDKGGPEYSPGRTVRPG